jgi:uncharacterized protein Yka (UPF0111/DUF47 family)
MNNQAEQDAYATAHAKASEYLASISDRIQNAGAPDDMTGWWNVADMEHLADQLRRIVEND